MTTGGDGGELVAEEALYDAYLDACLESRPEPPEEFFARHRAIGADIRARIESLYRLMCEREPSAATELPFERLGEFRLVRRLDAGGMGMVFLAEQESLGRTVALKIIRPELRHSTTAAERFRREALAVARLTHRNIVRVHAMGEEEGVRFIAMELVAGRTLDEVLARANARAEPLSRAQLVDWTEQLAGALAYAHEAGIVHRDVKPKNIQVTPEGVPMLLDFGVAHDDAADGATLTGTFTGSPLYAAPEQLTGARLDGRADVYALGATLYQCLTGRVPFPAARMEEVLRRVLTEEPTPPRRLDPSIPRDLEIVTLKALEKDPEARYASAAALAADLAALRESRPIAARAPSASYRFRKWCRRRPASAVALLAVVAGAVLVVSLLVFQQRAAARDRRDQARGLITTARQRVEQYRAGRAATAELELEIDRLHKQVRARYLSAEEDRLLDRKEDGVAAFRRERETLFHEVLELLRRAESLDPGVPGVRGARASLYLEKWHDARQRRDTTTAASYRLLVRETDPDGVYAHQFEHAGTLGIATTPPGATAYLFRFRLLSELVAGAEPRLVPVPVGDEPAVAPGTWCLRVVTSAGEIGYGDLIVRLGGYPIRGAMLTAAAADRLVSIGGEPVRDDYELRRLGAPGEPREFRFDRAGVVTARAVAELEATVAGPRAIAEAGGVPATIHRDGELLEVVLPPGLRVRTTTQPCFAAPGCRVGETPCRVQYLPDRYLILLRRPGRPDVRAVVVGEADDLVARAVRLSDAELPGFVFVSPRRKDEGEFWIQEREVTCAEYLEFADAHPEHAPRFEGKPVWARGADGRHALPGNWSPDWPAMHVSLHDARAYAAWRSERMPEWKFSLPGIREWSAAAGQRNYVYGPRYRPKWSKSCFARREPVPEPVSSFPLDESVFGVYDMAGSVSEWIDSAHGRGRVRVCGGSWADGDPERFRVNGGMSDEPATTIATIGFRLVARPAE